MLLPTKPRRLQVHLLPAHPTLRIRKVLSVALSGTKPQPAHRPLREKRHCTGRRRAYLHPLSGLVWRDGAIYDGTDDGADEQRFGPGERYDVHESDA